MVQSLTFKEKFKGKMITKSEKRMIQGERCSSLVINYIASNKITTSINT